MTNLKKFGRAIQKARVEQGISIEKLAKKVGISPQRLEDTEKGVDRRLKFREGIAIAEALGTKLSILMGG